MDLTGTKTSAPAVEWKLEELFLQTENGTPRSDRHALVVLNVPLRNIPVAETLWNNSAIRVAADGGANRLYDKIHAAGNQRVSSSSTGHLFEDLDVIIGDLDSLRPEVRQYFSNSPHKPTQVIFDPDQETTDFTKAVNHIRAHFAANANIVAIGSLGGRVDQGLSQIHHLYMFQDRPNYDTGRVYLVTDQSIAFLLKAGRHRIQVGGTARRLFDKYVGIVPCKELSVITTKGLEWDVQDWETQFGSRISTSNHVRPGVEVVEVETTKDVIFTIALNTGHLA